MSQHRTDQRPSGQNTGLVAVLQEDASRRVGALAGAADDENLAVAGKLGQARTELTLRDIDRARHALHGQLDRLAHVQQEGMSVAVISAPRWRSQ
jgi:hypothetical protein